MHFLFKEKVAEAALNLLEAQLWKQSFIFSVTFMGISLNNI